MFPQSELPFLRFLFDDEATSSVEYAVMVAMILLVCIVAVRALGDNQTGMWGNSVSKLEDVGFATK